MCKGKKQKASCVHDAVGMKSSKLVNAASFFFYYYFDFH